MIRIFSEVARGRLRSSVRSHWKSVPSTHIRCITTASFLATATMAFLNGILPLSSSAHRLSQDRRRPGMLSMQAAR